MGRAALGEQTDVSPRLNKAALEELYQRYNRTELARGDPLGFLYDYQDPGDREIVGLLASSLAYGRVAQILKSVRGVLGRMGASPTAFLLRSSRESLRACFAGFRHRFTTGENLCGLLLGAKRLVERDGSLESAFVAGHREDHETVLPALCAFADELRQAGGGARSHLLAAPSLGSACKRLHLFLRWMVRQDDVDPGGWGRVSASKLVVPLDVHMHRIGLALGLTTRKQADMRTALEITRGYREVAPDDPVRYDFALTRLGILGNGGLGALLETCRLPIDAPERRAGEAEEEH